MTNAETPFNLTQERYDEVRRNAYKTTMYKGNEVYQDRDGFWRLIGNPFMTYTAQEMQVAIDEFTADYKEGSGVAYTDLLNLATTIAAKVAKRFADTDDFEEFADSTRVAYMEEVERTHRKHLTELDNLWDGIDKQELFTNR